jgi:uncharacterized protein (TIGR00290 family)
MRVVASWSGGKDSCLACYKAVTQGYEVTHLVNFISRQFRRVSFHGVRARIISRQAQAIGIPLVQYTVPEEMGLYEQRFKQAVSALKRRGTVGMVFGDIYLQEHRDWIERVCHELEITPVMPLWGMPPERVLGEFINLGFEALVASAKADIFNEEWLGRRVDHSLFSELKVLCQQQDVDVCGEHGEYHTVAVDGPLFQKRMQLVPGAKVLKDGYWFLDFTRCQLKAK